MILLKKKYFAILCCLSLLVTQSLLAQNSKDAVRLYFKHLTINEGLSSNQVNCVFRDSRGFLWVGTSKGLDQYNGRDVKVFVHNRFKENSIVGNHILSISEDDSGYLWIGTKQGGISKFNPYNGEAINFIHDPQNPFSLNDNFDNKVYIDKSGKIWIGNNSGLSYFDSKSRHFIAVPISDSSNSQAPQNVGCMYEDSKGRFWVGSFNGLFLYHRKTKTFQQFVVNRKIPELGNPITCIFEDQTGNLWVGIWGFGLCLWNPKAHQLLSFKWNKNTTNPGAKNIVHSINETKTRKGEYILWVGTTKGLLKINLPSYQMINNVKALSNSITRQFKRPPFVNNNNELAYNFKGNLVNCLFKDQQGILWIGGDKGLNEFSPENQLFSFLPVIDGSITMIRKDTFQQQHRLLVTSWYGNGLTILNNRGQVVKITKKIPPRALEFNNGQISDILPTKDGKLWIATFNGLYSYNQKSGKYTAYLHKEKNDNSPTSNHIVALAKDDAGNIWLSIYRRGVDKLNPKTGVFTHFRHKKTDNNSLCDDLVWRIQKGKHGNLFFCTNNGLSIYNENDHHFTNLVENKSAPNSLSGEYVSKVIRDQSGLLWIATNNGLNCYDPISKKCLLYSSEEGLDNNVINDIAMDKQGRIWLVSDNNIAVFSPRTQSFINYNQHNGLFLTNISGPIINDENGNFLVGAENGLIKFSPAAFVPDHMIVPIYITKVEINGRLQSYSQSIKNGKKIVLEYPDNSFSCTFDAPDFFNGNSLKYVYRMDGIDTAWQDAGTQNAITYASLLPGNYIFHVKAKNRNANENQKGMTVNVEVLPPFWDTWWFRLIMVVLILVLIYALFLYRIRGIRKKEALKTAVNKQLADMRMKVLRTRMNPHFLFNSLNSIQECIYTYQTNAASKYLSKFSRLLRLILEKSENNFISIAEDIEMLALYLELESLRFEEEFHYKIIEEEIEIDFLKIPPLLIQPFVENALWHGLRHKEGEKLLNITYSADEDFILVTIEDNGIGRKASQNLKKDTTIKKQSLGIKISSEQLEMVSSISKNKGSIDIIDLLSENGIAIGTKVLLKIPIATDNF